jgi:alkaline phosphatase
MTTHARDTLSTDTAAAATAMSTGVKTRSGMIAITPEGERLATALQAAQLAGKRIGLVTTASVSDALPAAFSVHATSRRDHEAIVDCYLLVAPDVLLGGGADHFLPAGDGGRRRDARDVIREFDRKGYAVARTRTELTTTTGPRLLGLFAGADLGHEIDRYTTSQPSLGDMTEAALRVLARPDGKGFVLVVESEAVDSAGHANDVAALLHDLWAFDRAVQVALAFQAKAPGDTLVVVAGSHETGGFTPTLAPTANGRGVVVASTEHFQMLSRITMSFNRAAQTLGATPTESAIEWLVVKYFPGFTLDHENFHVIHHQEPFEPQFSAPTQSALGRMVARQTGFYWASQAHGAAPVVVGALGPGAALFRGWYDNTDFGRSLQQLIRGSGSPAR